jgi:hypothetical protein
MQTAAGFNRLAASAKLAELRLAAIPTISIRSGIVSATLIALAPIDPVDPRRITRRFLIELKILNRKTVRVQ